MWTSAPHQAYRGPNIGGHLGQGRDITAAARIRDLLRDWIRAEGLRPGDRLPTEAELTARFGVSRPALREALKGMELDGIIAAQRGSGRYVAPAMAVQVERPITAFESVTEMLGRAGHRPQTRLLQAGRVPSPPDVAAALGLAEDSPVWRLEKLRLIEGQPLLYSLEYLPLALLPPDHPVFDWSGSLMALMQGLGLAPVMSRATVSAVGPPETQADLGSLGAGGPLLLVAETCFTAAGQAVIRSLIYHAGHQFSFSFARK